MGSVESWYRADGGYPWVVGFDSYVTNRPFEYGVAAYGYQTGVYGNAPPNGGAVSFDDSSSIGTWLQASGYHTMFLGKYLNGYTMLWDETQGELPYVPPGWNDWQAFEQVKYYDYNII